jgi:V8-like Glu-specific endopeptidase
VRCRFLPVVAFLLAVAGNARADEGMWLLNELPTPAILKSTGVSPDAAFVERVQKGALRLANGCSASFVGKAGLVMTNHHCVRSCLEELSVAGKDLLNKPFVAKAEKDELRCTRFELNQLQKITNVTDVILKATAGKEGAAFQAALKAEKARLESTCSNGDASRRCEVITLFDGARFHLYEQRRFQDVRLVMAPEFPMAAFGGDPDNFNFPRTGFDVAFVRVYDNGVPFSTTDALSFADKAAKDGDPVFVVGHPGGTERTRTVAQLVFQRDVALPWNLMRLAELRGRLDEWMKAVPSRKVRGAARLRTVENGLKALRGRHETLARAGFMEARATAENDARRAAGPVSQQAFAQIDEANRAAARLWADHRLLEVGEAFGGDLFAHARAVVRARAEREKPDASRLPEFSDARIAQLRQQVAATAVIVPEDEIALLSWSLHRLRNLKGADHPLVKELLAGKSPDTVAKAVVTATKLKDPKVRAAAFDGDAAAWKVLENDPLVRMAHIADGPARAVRTQWEDEVEAKETKAGEVITTMRRSRPGATSGAPDATFSLRLSYGRVAGTTTAPATTTMADLFFRAGAEPPYLLSPSWTLAKKNLAPLTPMNVSTTNDIIGGNSGSPLLDARGDVVGLVFDGNLASLGGRYVYEPEENRAVSVHADAILAALKHVYKADRVLGEIEASRRR